MGYGTACPYINQPNGLEYPAYQGFSTFSDLIPPYETVQQQQTQLIFISKWISNSEMDGRPKIFYGHPGWEPLSCIDQIIIQFNETIDNICFIS